MTTTTFVRAALALSVLALAACGGDGKKTRQACDGDEQCSGGVCFESECYAACTDQSACAEDEFCVAKARGDEEVGLCVVAAEFAPCASVDDCSALRPRQCQVAACGADGTCGFDPLEDGTDCDGPDRPGFCQMGTCVTGDSCPNGACTAGETCENCPEDCCPAVEPCGDGACGGGEDCVSCPADCAGCVAGYLWTFDDGVSTGFSTEVTADPWQAPVVVQVVEGGPSFLGAFGKQTVRLTVGVVGGSTALPMAALPAGPLPSHDTVRLSFDLFVLGSWDGHAATDGSTYASMPDLWTWAVPAVEAGNSHSFSNCVEDVQTWPELFAAGAPNATNAAKNGAVSTDIIVTEGGCGDATYRVVATFAHADGVLEVVFVGNPNEYPNARNLANESWGLDNVKVELLCEACGS